MNKRLIISIIVVLIGGFLGNIFRYTETKADSPADFSRIPNNLGNYTGLEQQLADFASDVLQADITTLRDYFDKKTNSRSQLFIAYFGSQKYGSQIHSPKHCLPGGGWKIDDIEPYQIRLKDGAIKTVNRLVISVKSYKALMLYWYETRTGTIRSEYGLKLDLVKNALLMRPTDAAIVRLTIDASDGDFEKATRNGIDFLDVFHPFIELSLPF